MNRSVNRVLLGLVAVAVAATLASCGGADSSGDTTSADAPESLAIRPADEFVRRLATLLKSSVKKPDCDEIALIDSRSNVTIPCPAPVELRQEMGTLRVRGSEEHGPAAVIDYRTNSEWDGATVLAVVAPDRFWTIARFGLPAAGSIGTSDADSRDGFEDTVERYLAAVRERDCEAFLTVTRTDGLSGSEACKRLFEPTKRVAKRLRSDPEAQPTYVGGNATFGFFVLETTKPKPEATVISVGLLAEDGGEPTYQVLDLAATMPAEEQRKVRRQIAKGGGKVSPLDPLGGSMVDPTEQTGKKVGDSDEEHEDE